MLLPKAILFDLDDTIVSYSKVSKLAWDKVCSDFADKEKLFDAKTLTDAIKEAAKWYWSDPERHREGRLRLNDTRRDIVRLALKKLDCCEEEYSICIADNYSELHQDMIHMFDGAEATLTELTQRGIKLALLTNGNAEKQRYKINRFDLDKFFDTCLVEGEIGFGKPDIRVFQMALERLEVNPEQAWMVGDNLQWDIAAPQKLGIFSIWNDHAGKGLPEDSEIIPDRIISNISELRCQSPKLLSY